MSSDSADSTPEVLVTAVTIPKRHPFINWLLAILITALGVYLSIIQFAGLEWLSRSGCLIAVLGVWSGLGGIIQERLLIGRLNFHHRISLARAKRNLRKLKVSNENIESEIQTLEDDFEEKSDKILQAVRLQLGILEVSLLITGTLLWGFGDLFFILNI
ncbi:hypothetical protein [Colwellia sp. PAMC 21821]|uniref:hypothetical protein n=1 Tax=Colwellia sp. PAMC 21821 TaxID=1816219 RepID=UPI0009BE6EFD|nr:hypothetical protein [Colwellia sp. PAMC 21821]ARD46328.1 hypothetical protein A3Q33_19820 [Colwellia sp. PAMC 21821]